VSGQTIRSGDATHLARRPRAAVRPSPAGPAAGRSHQCDSGSSIFVRTAGGRSRRSKSRTGAAAARSTCRCRAAKAGGSGPDLGPRSDAESVAALRARRSVLVRRQAQGRQTFRQYVADYSAWAAVHKRSWRKTERYTAARLVVDLGDQLLETITTADVERVLDRLMTGRTGATRNRVSGPVLRDVQARRPAGLVSRNPVTGIPKLPEPGRRRVFLDALAETVLREALPARLRPTFTLAVHTANRPASGGATSAS
jgi:hypothetical protein